MKNRNPHKKIKSSVKHTSIKTLREKLQEIYNRVNLSTTCCGHCVCCNVACPQMNYSEFLVIVDRIYNHENKNIRIEILKKSIIYFFSNSLVKPCPLLVGTKCLIYNDRPLSCRMYGQWPNELYEERVQRFMNVTGLQRQEIPLNTQCEYVKRVDNSIPLTKQLIDSLYDAINNLDKATGSFTNEQIGKRYNQRTWHDWYMVSVFGEQRLAEMTNFFLAAETKEIVDDFVNQMCIQIDKIGQSLFKNPLK